MPRISLRAVAGAVGVATLGVVAAGVGIAGASDDGSELSAPVTHALTGKMTLIALVYGKTCSGDKGYGDLRGGAPVTIYDGAGAVVAVTQLGQGYAGDESGTFLDDPVWYS